MTQFEAEKENITKIREKIAMNNNIIIHNNHVFIVNLTELPYSKKTCENGNWGISDITGRKIKNLKILLVLRLNENYI